MQIEDLMQTSNEMVELCRLALEQNPGLKEAGFFPYVYKGEPYLINDMYTAALLSSNSKLLMREVGVEGRPDAPKVYACLPPPDEEAS